jgi:hypothetical protein
MYANISIAFLPPRRKHETKRDAFMIEIVDEKRNQVIWKGTFKYVTTHSQVHCDQRASRGWKAIMLSGGPCYRWTKIMFLRMGARKKKSKEGEEERKRRWRLHPVSVHRGGSTK